MVIAYDFVSKSQFRKERKFLGKTIQFPSRHPMSTLLESDGEKTSFLGSVSKHVFTEDGQEYLDLGANIGDSALVIEHFSPFRIRGTLVEPSEFFFPYLRANARHLKQPTLINSFASSVEPPADLYGKLMHWAGNAEVVTLDSKRLLASKEDQVTVAELTKTITKLVKIDCEGQDVLMASSYLCKSRPNYPVFFFELTLKSESDVSDLMALVELAQVNYANIIAMKDGQQVIYFGKFDLGFVRKVVRLWESLSAATVSGQLQLEIACFTNGERSFDEVLISLSEKS
jgi:hypothetical protein